METFRNYFTIFRRFVIYSGVAMSGFRCKCDRFIAFLFTFCILAGCSDDKQDSPVGGFAGDLTIAVISDPHLYDPMLGTDGDAFARDVAKDRKLVVESDAILNAEINRLIAEKPDIVLIPGDFTYNGEYSSHLLFVDYLKKLKSAGIKVFVVPGNHDISNPNAKGYTIYGSSPVVSVNEYQFRILYSTYGYGSAIYQDKNSLSYVAELSDKLWIICIDTRIPGESGGAVMPATLEWMKNVLARAAEKNITVIGMMHHGITEHFTNQSVYFPQYVIKDWATIAPELADLGLKAVFTGHFHSNDVTMVSGKKSRLFDIETGSLVTYPCRSRIVRLSAGRMTLTPCPVDYSPAAGETLREYSLARLLHGIDTIVKSQIMSTLNITEAKADYYIKALSPYYTSALPAHFLGDESPSVFDLNGISKLKGDPDFVMVQAGCLLQSLWSDLPPADNTLTIDLNSGEVIK